MSNIIIAGIMVACTVLLYILATKLHQRVKSQITLPIFIVSLFIVIILLAFKIPYETYMIGGKWIEFLMGPAVVALAYPLYNHFDMLKKLAVPIIIGTAVGAVIGVSTGVLMAKWVGVGEDLIVALASKSVTTPVSMAIVETLGGPMSLAAIFVIIAGAGGIMLSPYIFKLFRITHVVGRGVGIGSASHAIGTATAMENSAIEGSISTVSMVISAVLVSVITPPFIIVLSQFNWL